MLGHLGHLEWLISHHWKWGMPHVHWGAAGVNQDRWDDMLEGADLDRDLPEGSKAQQMKTTCVSDSTRQFCCFRITGGSLDQEVEE
jgi:hypothetical protein